MRTIILFILFILFSLSAFAQSYKTEDQHLKGWTKDAKIYYADFKGKPSEGFKKLNKEFGLPASAKIGLRSILDVPKKKRDRGRLLEKLYVAPFFIKSASVTTTKDEAELDKQRLYFDMAELHARMMRKDIHLLQDSTKAYGTLYILYSSIKDHYCNELKRMFDDYTVDVFVDKKEGEFEKWRDIINEQLRELEEYATTRKDCHRLLTGLPVDVDYEESEKVLDSFMRCGQ